MSSYKVGTSERWRCPVCGGEKDIKAEICRDCYLASRRREVPDPVMIRRVLDLCQWNYSAAGRYFCVSDNAVRKWCHRFNIQEG